MATKTVVCPECGAVAAAGRYACADCGAMLASVAVTARSWSEDEDPLGTVPDSSPGTVPDSSPGKVPDASPAGSAALAPVAPAPPVASAPPLSARTRPGWQDAEHDSASLSGAALVGGPAIGAEPPSLTAAAADGGARAFDEDAPLGSVGEDHVASQPRILHHVPDATGSPADAVAATRSGSLPSAGLAGEMPGGVAGAELPIQAAADEPPAQMAGAESPTQVAGADSPAVTAGDDAPAWPPAGDRGPVARPEPRTPAGSYLPPSAVLPPLDRPSSAVAFNVGVGAAAASIPPPSAGDGSGVLVDGPAGRLSAYLDTLTVTSSAARRTIAAGAAFAALGMLLPWLNGNPAEGVFAGYFQRWGLAGPGLWLVFLAVVVLVLIAGSGGRPATWPLGLPAIVAGAFLIGLLWPSIAGGSVRGIGVWITLVGALVLIVAGSLDRRDRHVAAAPTVSSDGAGGR